MSTVVPHPEVAEALRRGRPVVALETAVLTHGLPRTPVRDHDASGLRDLLEGGNADAPLNLETVRAMSRVVRAGDAVPAVVAVLDGTLHVGIEDDALARLARDESARKVSVGNLAHALATGANAGTTVSATLQGCVLVEGSPIRVLVTGGIGGVHPGWAERPDVSADLPRLATSPVCVVCAGAKSILDLPATLEALETLGVPVVGHRTDRLPRFHAPGTDELRLTQRVDDAAAAAAVCHAHWFTLGERSAVILANEVPAAFAVETETIERVTRASAEAADAQGVRGPDRTPFELADLAARTDGAALRANVALLLENARLAAEVARALGSV